MPACCTAPVYNVQCTRPPPVPDTEHATLTSCGPARMQSRGGGGGGGATTVGAHGYQYDCTAVRSNQEYMKTRVCSLGPSLPWVSVTAEFRDYIIFGADLRRELA